MIVKSTPRAGSGVRISIEWIIGMQRNNASSIRLHPSTGIMGRAHLRRE
jgi:hypothetical protein